MFSAKMTKETRKLCKKFMQDPHETFMRPLINQSKVRGDNLKLTKEELKRMWTLANPPAHRPVLNEDQQSELAKLQARRTYRTHRHRQAPISMGGRIKLSIKLSSG